jgi:hypothetical protein
LLRRENELRVSRFAPEDGRNALISPACQRPFDFESPAIHNRPKHESARRILSEDDFFRHPRDGVKTCDLHHHRLVSKTTRTKPPQWSSEPFWVDRGQSGSYDVIASARTEEFRQIGEV